MGSPAGASLAIGQGVFESLDAQIALEYLPAYAPELNPVEYIWGYLKHHAMPNFCARDLGDLKRRASRSLRSMQRRATLVTAFWQQAELF
jgi:transposase